MPESLPAPLVGTILDELETILQRAHWTLNELQETIDDRRTTKSLVAGRQLMLDVGNVQMAIGRLVALEGKEVELVRVSGRGRRWFVLALGGEVAVIAGAGVYAVIVSGTQSLPEHARAIVVALLACAMGWRNRAILEAENPRRADHGGADQSGQGTRGCRVGPLGVRPGVGAGAVPLRRDHLRHIHRWSHRGASAPARPRARADGRRRIRGLRSGPLLPCSPVSAAGERRTLICARHQGPARISSSERDARHRSGPPGTRLSSASLSRSATGRRAARSRRGWRALR